MSNSPQDANSRITEYWEKFSLYACGIAITLICFLYLDQRSRIDKLEERTQFLMVDKVNQGQLKDAVSGIMSRIDATDAANASRQASDKADILDRMDLYFGKNGSK